METPSIIATPKKDNIPNAIFLPIPAHWHRNHAYEQRYQLDSCQLYTPRSDPIPEEFYPNITVLLSQWETDLTPVEIILSLSQMNDRLPQWLPQPKLAYQEGNTVAAQSYGVYELAENMLIIVRSIYICYLNSDFTKTVIDITGQHGEYDDEAHYDIEEILDNFTFVPYDCAPQSDPSDLTAHEKN